jgi:hypothetical protein
VRERERKIKYARKRIAYYLTLNKKHCIAQKIKRIYYTEMIKALHPPLDILCTTLIVLSA